MCDNVTPIKPKIPNSHPDFLTPPSILVTLWSHPVSERSDPKEVESRDWFHNLKQNFSLDYSNEEEKKRLVFATLCIPFGSVQFTITCFLMTCSSAEQIECSYRPELDTAWSWAWVSVDPWQKQVAGTVKRQQCFGCCKTLGFRKKSLARLCSGRCVVILLCLMESTMAPINACDRKKTIVFRLTLPDAPCGWCQVGGYHVTGKNSILTWQSSTNDWPMHPSSYHTPCFLEMVRAATRHSNGFSTLRQGFYSSNIART